MRETVDSIKDPCPHCQGVTVRFKLIGGTHKGSSECKFSRLPGHLSPEEILRRRLAFDLSPDEFAKMHPEAVVI